MKNLSSRSQFPVPHTARTKKNNVAAQENGTKELAPAFATERCLGAKQRGDKSNSSYVCVFYQQNRLQVLQLRAEIYVT